MDSLISRAGSNDKHAQAELSLAYFIGNDVTKDIDKGADWFNRASDDISTLKKVIAVSSVSAHPDSCIRLYGLWKTLKPIEQENSEIAIQFLIMAAKGGIANAQHLLAIQCASGRLVPEEYRGNECAIFWHMKSLENGHTDAHRYLASTYSDAGNNNDVLDYEKAFYHLSHIVENGSVNAVNQYGMAYVNGQGVEKNVIEGVKWLFISKCRSTNFKYLEDIEAAVELLSPEEYKKARAAAIDWIKANAHSARSFFIRDGYLIDPISRERLDITLDNEPEPELGPDPDIDNAVTAEIIPKWHQYVAGSKDVTDDDVHTLLMEGASDAQLQDIFQYYDCKEELIARYKTARKPGIKDTKIALIAAAAKADLLFKYKLCTQSKRASSYAYFTDLLSEEMIQNSHVKVVDDNEFDEKRADLFYEAVNEIITDELAQYKVPGSSGLDEALIGALQDYDLKNHVLCAFVTKKDWAFSAYLDVVRMGAEYDLSGNELLIKIDYRRIVVE